MRKFTFILLFLGICIPCLKAQNDTIVIEQKNTIIVSDTSSLNNALTDFLTYFIEKNKKRNTKSSFERWEDNFYFSMGLIFGGIENSSADLLYGKSYNCDFGVKTAYNISKIYAFTFNIGFSYNRYQIANGIQNGIF